MYAKYNRCPSAQFKKQSIPYVPPIASPGPGAMTESDRMVSERCPKMWVTTFSGPDVTTSYYCTDPAKIRIEVPVTPAAPIPYVPTTTTPASLTTQQLGINVLGQESNPYDPATRFRQYFPPAPLPYVCPERIPSNDPKPSTNPCLPVTRFHGSEYEAARART